MSKITPTRFWDLFAENLPNFRPTELRTSYHDMLTWTQLIYPFTISLLDTIRISENIPIMYNKTLRRPKIFYTPIIGEGYELIHFQHDNLNLSDNIKNLQKLTKTINS